MEIGGGVKSYLKEKGVDLKWQYKFDQVHNITKNTENTRPALIHDMDFTVTLDGEKLWGSKGESLYFYVISYGLSDQSHPISSVVDDAQTPSNIATNVNDTKVYEAWYQKNFDDDKISLLAGYHDLNTEFYSTDSSLIFLNSSFGVGAEQSQTGVAGPSIFPFPSLGVRLKMQVNKEFYTQSALVFGQAAESTLQKNTTTSFRDTDGMLFVTETGSMITENEKNQKIAVGLWTYTKTADHLNRSVTDSEGNSFAVQTPVFGGYFILDKDLSESFSFFLRYGKINDGVYTIDTNYSLGVDWKNPLGRKQDKMGIAITTLKPTTAYKENKLNQDGVEVTSEDTTYEWVYRWQLRPGFTLIPSFQYITHPYFKKDADPQSVGILRLELNI